MEKLYSILVILILSQFVFCQVKTNVVPFIRNYTPLEYVASDQNWSAVQDNRGVMYFGNNDNGVLEYDGKSWRKIPVSNNSIVRSLAIDKNGTIFVGAVDEFGYLEPDSQGKLKYVSLTDDLDSADQQFADIWKTYTINDKVYFCSSYKIFEYDYSFPLRVADLPKYSLFSFVLDNRIFTGNYGEGLLEFKNDSFNVVKGGDFYMFKNVFGILPYDKEKLLIATHEDGLFLYDSITGISNDGVVTEKANKFLKQNLVYYAIALPGKKYAFATLVNGVVIINRKGEIEQQFNKQIGLQDETAICLYNNSEDHISQLLWITLNVGISKVEINSPFSIFSEGLGLKGSVNDVIRHNGKLYVATSSGIFYLSYDKNNNPELIPVENTDVLSQSKLLAQAWDFMKYKPPGTDKEKLLAGTSKGVFEICDNGTARSVENQFRSGFDRIKRFNTFKLYSNPGVFPDKVFVGRHGGLVVFNYLNNRWEYGGEILNIKDEVRSVAVDNDSAIWFVTYFNGVYKARLSEQDTVLEQYNTENGLPSLKEIHVYNYRDKLLFATEKGFYNYDVNRDRFVPDSVFGDSYCNGSKGIFRYIEDSTGNIWLTVYRGSRDNNENRFWIEMISRENGNIKIDSLPFRRLPYKQIDAIYPEPRGITWFGISDCLYSYDITSGKNFYIPYYTLIREVTLTGDSILFHGTNFRSEQEGISQVVFSQGEHQVPELDYRYRSITFHYAAPFYEEEDKTRYSYILEGYNDTWSKWSFEMYKDYTNLREGDYTFRVKAKNIYGIESDVASYSFTILPPWYRTVWAYAGYVILFFVIFYIGLVINTRRLRAAKIRLEKTVRERTHEIMMQKEEIQQQRDEIEAQRDEIQAQRDLATSQRDTIADQKKEITDSIYYAKRIQNALLPPLIFLEKHLPEHFIMFKPRDIVSGDFYWATEKGNKLIITAADCTGHGVPGGFMSMLGISFLNEIVNQKSVIQANEILNSLRNNIISSLHQTSEDDSSKDGMDIAMCVIDLVPVPSLLDKEEVYNMEFAGANNPLYIIRKNGDTENPSRLTVIKGDNMPIGIHVNYKRSFTNHKIQVKKGDRLYLFSDGYADQFGGPKGKKFKYKNFKNLLIENYDKPMPVQEDILEKALKQWQGDHEQVDDIIVIGIRI